VILAARIGRWAGVAHQSIASPLVLLLTVEATGRAWRTSGARAAARDHLSILLAIPMTYVALRTCFGNEVEATASDSLVLFAGAAAEEVVFRSVIPRRIAQAWSRRGLGTSGRVIGQVGAQVLFACSHFAPSLRHAAAPGADELLRLTACGLSYTLLAESAGLWLAIAVHTSLNTHAVLSLHPWRRPSLFIVALTALVGVAGLWARCARPHRQPSYDTS
jgi:membrane protease YdiL (CAAX protease family)